MADDTVILTEKDVKLRDGKIGHHFMVIVRERLKREA